MPDTEVGRTQKNYCTEYDGVQQTTSIYMSDSHPNRHLEEDGLHNSFIFKLTIYL